MKIKVRLKNHGHIEGQMRQGGDVVEIDEKDFTDTWMEKLETIPDKPTVKEQVKKFLKRS